MTNPARTPAPAAPAGETLPPADELLARRQAPWVAFGILALLALLLYLPALKVGLLSDDWGLSDPLGNPWEAFRGHWFGGTEGHFYRPLARLVPYYGAALFGYSGVGQHIVSLLLHIGTAAWVLWGLRRVGLTAAGLAAAAIALLHPVAVETVTWISSQGDLLVNFFFAGAFALALARPTKRTLGASFAFAALGYLSKETAIVLGPSLVLAAGYAWLVTRAAETRRLLLIAAGGHAALWVAYMLLRKATIGMFLTAGVEGIGAVGFGNNMLAALHALVEPAFAIAGQREALATSATVLWPVIAALPLAAALLALLRRHVEAGAVLLLFVAVLPFARQMSDSTVLLGQQRFLYHPLWMFAVVVGLAIEPLLRRAAQPRVVVLTVLALGVLLVRCTHLASVQLVHFERAAGVRQAIAEEMAEALAGAGEALIVIDQAPDHIGGAYIFRNGFEEFARLTFPQVRLQVTPNLSRGHLRAGRRVFRLRARGPLDRPYFTEDREIAARLQAAAAAEPPKPFRTDFSDQRINFHGLPRSEDIRPVGWPESGGFRYRVIGPDPNVAIPSPTGFRTWGFSRITVVLEFVEPSGGPASYEVAELIFLPKGEGRVPITVSQPIEVRAGRQEIAFEVGGNADWLLAGELVWMRLDPCHRYRGLVDLHEIRVE